MHCPQGFRSPLGTFSFRIRNRLLQTSKSNGSLPTNANRKSALAPITSSDYGHFAHVVGAGSVEDFMGVAMFSRVEGVGVGREGEKSSGHCGRVVFEKVWGSDCSFGGWVMVDWCFGWGV